MRGLEKKNVVFTKNGRELQELLGSTKDYVSWVKDQINKLSLKGDFDYQIVTEKSHTNKPKLTHYFTDAAAYRIASHTEVRTEAAAMIKDNLALSTMAVQGNEDAIILQAMAIMQGRVEKLLLETQTQAKQLMEQAPKVEAYEQLMECTNAFKMEKVAKVIAVKNMGRNSLFAYLREKGVLNSSNTPYQYYINKSWFKLKENVRKHPLTGERLADTTTVVLQRGVDGIRKMLIKDGYKLDIDSSKNIQP